MKLYWARLNTKNKYVHIVIVTAVSSSTTKTISVGEKFVNLTSQLLMANPKTRLLIAFILHFPPAARHNPSLSMTAFIDYQDQYEGEGGEGGGG